MDAVTVRLTLVLSGGGPAGRPVSVDVALGGPGGTTWADLVDLVGAVTGLAARSLRGLPVRPGSVLGAPPLVNGAVLCDAAPVEAPTLLEAQIEHGPDAGRTLPLPPGTWSIGRAGCDLALTADPAVSRRQARILVGHRGVLIEPLPRTTPTLVNGETITSTTSLAVGDRVRLGSTRLRIGTADAPGDPPRAAAEGRFTMPDPPAPSETPPFSWLTAAVGLATSLALAWALGSAVFLLFGVAGPLLAGGQWLGQRRHLRQTDRQRLREHERRCARVAAEVDRALRRELRTRRGGGSLRDVLDQAVRGPAGVWPAATPGDLAVVLGVGRVDSLISVTVGDRTHIPRLEDAPLRRELPERWTLAGAGALALCGALIGRLAVAHPPGQLVVAVVSDRLAEWAWVAWLPHARRTAGVPSRPAGSTWTAGATDAEGLLDALRGAMAAGLPAAVLVWDLPPPPPAADRLRVIAVRASPDPTTDLLVRADGSLLEADPAGWRPLGTADLPSPAWVQRLSRALAAHPAPRGTTTITDVRLVTLLPGTSAAQVAADWARGRGTGAVTVGVLVGTADHEPARLDLIGHGPHLLVAGTTGSGKSEALRTLVLSLALAEPPADVAFVLIDFKGGAAFGACRRLPHVAGLVTDLDGDGTRRALDGLRAELRRRERLMAAAGVADLTAYRRVQTERSLPPLGRIVVVVDEFRALADALPEDLSSLVRLAGQGRSLGLHLVLATQRPTGAVGAEIRANITMRLALRTADVTESRDVVDCADAATLPVHAPGRAVLRVGSEPPVHLQIARVDRATGPARPWAGLVPPFPEDGDRTAGAGRGPGCGDAQAATPARSDLEQVVEAIEAATGLAGSSPADPLWCPPLPEQLAAGVALPGDAIPLGLLDDPEAQRQVVAGWMPGRDGGLAVLGSAGSGRSTTMRRLLLAGGHLPHRWFVLDLQGGLAGLATLPWVVGTATGDDTEHLGRMLAALEADADQAVLLVHGWDEIDRSALPDLEPRVTRLARGAGPGRAAVAVSGGRALLGSRMLADLPCRLVHRLGDPADAAMAGLRRADLPRRWPPGRAVATLPRWIGPRQLQVAEPDPPPDPVDADRQGRARHRIDPLPASVGLSRLSPSGDGLTFGVTPDGVATWDPHRSPVLLVLGPPGSGRTALLETLASAAARVSPDPDLLTVDDADLLGTDRLDRLRIRLCAPEAPPAVIVIGSLSPHLLLGPRLATLPGGRPDGVVLRPAAFDGDALGVRLSALGADRPGRGVLVVRGRVVPLQVARPPPHVWNRRGLGNDRTCAMSAAATTTVSPAMR